MRLHGYWRSSSTWRVRIALEWKGLAYEVVPVHLLREGGEQKRAAFRAHNAMAQVPVLEVDEGGVPRALAQSLPILEYLEETHPAPPLLPRGPYLRQRARQLAEIVNSGIQPLQNLAVMQAVEAVAGPEAAREFAVQAITRGLDAIEVLLGETAGRCAVGDAPTVADAFLVPQLYNARRFSLELARYPRLLAVEAHCLSLPAFQRSHPDRQPDAVPS